MRDGAVLAKRCPQCGRLLARDSLRCGYCLAEVRDIEADTEVELAPATASATVRGRLGGLSTRLLGLPKWVLLLVPAILVAGGWYGYQALKPDRTLALPSSAARSIPASPDVWASSDGNALRTRSTDAAVRLDGAAIAWQTDLGVTTAGPPVADEARLYVPTTDNRLVALNLSDGSLAWIYEAPVPMSEAPVAAGGRVYQLTRGGDVLCLDATTGTAIWTAELPTNFFNSPALVDGVLYAYGATKLLYGLDSEDGHVLWTVGTGAEWATLPPVVAGGWIIIVTGDAVKVYDRKSGGLRLEHPHSRVTGLALAEERIVSVSSSFIAEVDPHAKLPWWWGLRGAWLQLWVWGLAPEPPRSGLEWLTILRPQDAPPQEPNPEVFAPASSGDLVVVANKPGLVRAFDTGDGSQRWSIDVGEVTGAPVWTASGLLLPLHDALSLRSRDDGHEVARRELPAAARRSVMVMGQGTFLSDAEGRVIAIR